MQTYFHWVDANQTTFEPGFAVSDEVVLAWRIAQSENDFAVATVEMPNPRVGLLATGRKVWAWLSYDAGDGVQPLLFGRLVGVPTSVLAEVVTLEFIAKPGDYNAQKAALSDTMKVLPNYDPAFVDAQFQADPDVVLEGYSRLWHTDRLTHVVTASDVLSGEDGTITIAAADHFYEDLQLNIAGVPLTAVTVDLEMQWTQYAQGTVDLSGYLRGAWPGGAVTSYTMTASDWPAVGSSLGDGWTVAMSSVRDEVEITTYHKTDGLKLTLKWLDGDQLEIETRNENDYLRNIPSGSIYLPPITTASSSEATPGNISSSFSTTDAWVILHEIDPSLIAAYKSERLQRELVSFTLVADVQALLTDPGTDEAQRIALKSADLSEPIDTGDVAPIIDPRRRSYITTDRGRQSLEYAICRARASLLIRSRAVEIQVRTTFAKAVQATLRKNATIHDDRLPGGQASGKIIGYSMELVGDQGEIACFVKIGCAVGRGGSLTAEPGEPTYVEDGYVDPDYQEYTGQVVLMSDDDVGYETVLADPNDDGLDFLSATGLAAADVIDVALAVENPASEQVSIIETAGSGWLGVTGLATPILGETSPIQEQQNGAVQARSAAIQEALKDNATTATFTLKSMRATFETSYEVTMTDLKIPTMIDLEAA